MLRPAEGAKRHTSTTSPAACVRGARADQPRRARFWAPTRAACGARRCRQDLEKQRESDKIYVGQQASGG